VGVVNLLPAAILASALMFFLGWWVGRLQREAETAPRPTSVTTHRIAVGGHSTGGNVPWDEPGGGW
jgi:hypothetical protein